MKSAIIAFCATMVTLAPLSARVLCAETGSAEFEPRRTAKAIPPAFFGVHFFQLGEIGWTKDFNPMTVRDLISDLRLTLISGPDGGPANFYLFKEGFVLTPRDPRFQQYYGNAPRWPERPRLREGYPRFYLKDAFKIAEDLGLQYIFVMNVTSQSIDDIRDEVLAMKQTTKVPLRIEMGNEVYNRANTATFPTAESYVDKCRQIYGVVKRIDPQIQLGIVATGKDLEDEMIPRKAQQQVTRANELPATRANRVGSWNRAVIANMDIYDAVTTHSYIHIGKVDRLNAQDFMRFLYAFNQNVYGNIFRQARQFPGKEIWLSAWGTLPSFLDETKDDAFKARMQFRKSPGFAIHTMERLMLMIQSGLVKYSSYHTLVDPQGNGIVQQRVPQDPSSELIKLPNYYAFKAVGDLLHENPCFYDVRLVHGDVRPEKVLYTVGDISVDVPDAGAWGFGTKDVIRKVVLANRTDTPIEARVQGLHLRPVWIYGGGDPLPDFLSNPNASWLDPPRHNPIPETPRETYTEAIQLKPFSMTIVEVKTR